MAEDVDFWEVLDEAERTIDAWPAWQRRYDADVHYEQDRMWSAPAMPAL